MCARVCMTTPILAWLGPYALSLIAQRATGLSLKVRPKKTFSGRCVNAAAVAHFVSWAQDVISFDVHVGDLIRPWRRIQRYVCLSVSVSVSLFVPVCLCLFLSASLSLCLCLCLSLLVCLHGSIYLSVYLSVCLSIYAPMYVMQVCRACNVCIWCMYVCNAWCIYVVCVCSACSVWV